MISPASELDVGVPSFAPIWNYLDTYVMFLVTPVIDVVMSLVLCVK